MGSTPGTAMWPLLDQAEPEALERGIFHPLGLVLAPQPFFTVIQGLCPSGSLFSWSLCLPASILLSLPQLTRPHFLGSASHLVYTWSALWDHPWLVTAIKPQ